MLGPTLAPGDMVVMDHLRAHKAVGIQQALARRGARLLYLPPYSPDLAPIEPSWSRVKTALRKAKARVREALDVAIMEALATVTAEDDKIKSKITNITDWVLNINGNRISPDCAFLVDSI